MSTWLEGTEDPFKDLPPSLLAVAREISTATQTPLSFAVLTILTVLATAYQSRITIHSPGGQVGLASLYSLVIGKASSGKSEVFKHLTKGLTKYYAEYQQEQDILVRQSRAKRKVWEVTVKGVERAIRSAKPDSPIVDELSDRLAELEMNPPTLYAPGFMIDGDVSLHVVRKHYSGAGKSGLLMHQEASRILKGDFMAQGTDFINSVYTKDDPSRSRAHLVSNTVDARLTIMFMTQTGVIDSVVKANGGSFITSGLAARFFITSDDGYTGNGEINVEHLPETDAFNEMVYGLMRAPIEPVKEIRFSLEAKPVFRTLRQKIHRDTQDDGPLTSYGAVAKRTLDKSAKVAGILTQYLGEDEISASTYGCAKAVALKFMFDAQRLLSGGNDVPAPERFGKLLEERLMRKILYGESMELAGPLTYRQLQRLTHMRNAELIPAVDFLAKQGKVRIERCSSRNGVVRPVVFLSRAHFFKAVTTSAAFPLSVFDANDDDQSHTETVHMARDYGHSAGRY